eukprot:9175984-Pyramimonas_sp.AAC.1
MEDRRRLEGGEEGAGSNNGVRDGKVGKQSRRGLRTQDCAEMCAGFSVAYFDRMVWGGHHGVPVVPGWLPVAWGN